MTDRAAADIHPDAPPPGYGFVLDDEPVFDPAIHLQLEPPERIWTMAELGYDQHVISRFASPIAMTSPARVLSEAGAAVLQEIAHRLQPFIRYNSASTRVPAALRGTTHRSRFVRDLCRAPEVTAFFSEMFQTPLMPHTISHHQGHMNFQPRELSQNVDSWHHDLVAFDWVMMVHDPASIRGGRFQMFDGTREEGWAIARRGEEIPPERILTPDFPAAGYACFMQGAAVFHRASRMEQLGFRASLVQSYVSRDTSVPDPNRIYWVETTERNEQDPNFMLERRCAPAEWARHRAWVARQRLEDLIERTPLDAPVAEVEAAIDFAVADLNDLLAMLRRGPVPPQEVARIRDAIDAAQLA